MKTIGMKTVSVVLGFSPLLLAANAMAQEERSHRLDAAAIGKAAGTEAAEAEGGVVRIGWARDDVKVTVDGTALHPFAGLGSWAAFKSTPHGAMVMGDTVVFQDEVGPAMDAAFANGLEVSALHNHFFYDEPKVYFMHVGGTGDPEELASGVKALWDAIKDVRKQSPMPATKFSGKAPSRENSVSPQVIEKVLGKKPEVKGGVAKVSFGRTGQMHGVEVGGPMGLSTWAAFSGADQAAIVDGDFIMTAEEVQPVLHTLRERGIHIVALHNHMIGEEPAFFFTHYWGKGSAQELAEGLKAALDVQQEAHGDTKPDTSSSHKERAK